MEESPELPRTLLTEIRNRRQNTAYEANVKRRGTELEASWSNPGTLPGKRLEARQESGSEGSSEDSRKAPGTFAQEGRRKAVGRL